MKVRYGFLGAATGLVAINWFLSRILERNGVPSWWTWVLVGAMLIAAVRLLTRDAVFLHSFLPAALGTVVPTLLWWLFGDANLRVQYFVGLGIGFGLLVGGLAALGMALTRTTNPQA